MITQEWKTSLLFFFDNFIFGCLLVIFHQYPSLAGGLNTIHQAPYWAKSLSCDNRRKNSSTVSWFSRIFENHRALPLPPQCCAKFSTWACFSFAVFPYQWIVLQMIYKGCCCVRFDQVNNWEWPRMRSLAVILLLFSAGLTSSENCPALSLAIVQNFFRPCPLKILQTAECRTLIDEVGIICDIFQVFLLIPCSVTREDVALMKWSRVSAPMITQGWPECVLFFKILDIF